MLIKSRLHLNVIAISIAKTQNHAVSCSCHSHGCSVRKYYPHVCFSGGRAGRAERSATIGMPLEMRLPCGAYQTVAHSTRYSSVCRNTCRECLRYDDHAIVRGEVQLHYSPCYRYYCYHRR